MIVVATVRRDATARRLKGVRQAVPLATKYKRTDHDQFVTFAHSFAEASVFPHGATSPLGTFVNQG